MYIEAHLLQQDSIVLIVLDCTKLESRSSALCVSFLGTCHCDPEAKGAGTSCYVQSVLRKRCARWNWWNVLPGS